MSDEESTLPPELVAKLKQMPTDDVDFVPRASQPEEPDKPAPRHAKKRHWRGRIRPPSSETFPWLDDHFLEDAKAGASDDDLSRWSGLSKNTIVRWRRARGIKRAPKNDQRKALALNLFGTDHGDVLHRCDDSPIEGLWEVPEFVLRKPLAYGEMARHLWFLRAKLGSSVKMLAKSFGIRERDVESALALYDAFLEKNGRPCDRCGLMCLRTERYCSKECWDTAKKETGDRR